MVALRPQKMPFADHAEPPKLHPQGCCTIARQRIPSRGGRMSWFWGGHRGARLRGSVTLTSGDHHRLKRDTLPRSVAPDPCSRFPLRDVSPLHDVRRPLADVAPLFTGHHRRVPVDLDLGVPELERVGKSSFPIDQTVRSVKGGDTSPSSPYNIVFCCDHLPAPWARRLIGGSIVQPAFIPLGDPRTCRDS
jgi:hypothetical protein